MYPRPAFRVVPREQESSGRGHWALESHCTESADDARAGGIIYWTCHWFPNGFSKAAAFMVPHSSLLICPFATNHTKDQKAQHGTQEMLYSWGAEVRHEVGYCHRWFYFGVIFSWGVCGHHHHEVRGEGLDLEGRGFEFKRYTCDLHILESDWVWINPNQNKSKSRLPPNHCFVHPWKQRQN